MGSGPGDLVPYGYMVTEGLLIPSTRLVEALGMTEADVVRDLYARIAAGSSAVQEVTRFNALGVPTTRYYSNGVSREGTKWHPGPVATLIASPTYRGVHILQSRHGAIEREVRPWSITNSGRGQYPAPTQPPSPQEQRHAYLSPARADYLRIMWKMYLGQIYRNVNKPPGFYYRCGGRYLTHYPNRTERCRQVKHDSCRLD